MIQVSYVIRDSCHASAHPTQPAPKGKGLARQIQNLVLINPDNPSGNYIPRKDMMEIIAWAADRKIRLVVDESFIDFSDEENGSLIDQQLITANPHLYVMKSISKSYGVPGLRLGVLVSGDTETISFVKKDEAIWNINSFAEFFMQIEEKYKTEYKASLAQIKSERRRFQSELSTIEGFRVNPSQGNFIMVELPENLPAKSITKKMLVRYNILIKDISAKTNGRNFIRIAVRSTAENDKLLNALRKEACSCFGES